MHRIKFTLITLIVHPSRRAEAFATIKSGVSSSLPPSPLNDVKVFDDVFSPDTCEYLHDLSVEHAERSRSSIFSRFPAPSSSNRVAKTPLEKAIDNLLDEIEPNTSSVDKASVVEYWSRSEYMNIDAHCDIDERHLQNEGTLRYPDWSHVLYLRVETAGPTTVFDREGGWGGTRGDEDGVVAVVPAVTGRLLRFPGRLMHGVPKPPHRWVLTEEEEAELTEEEEWGEDEEWERSVLLFNVWSSGAPLGVLPDSIAGGMPDGVEIDAADWKAHVAREEARQLQEWEEEYGAWGGVLRCRRREEWRCRDSRHVMADGGKDLI